MQTDNLELKKLVYLYLINYAKSQPDLAILAVDTFVKVELGRLSYLVAHIMVVYFSTGLDHITTASVLSAGNNAVGMEILKNDKRQHSTS
ncbi:Beta-adaptin-like protein C [Artemisia annua]|uniref:Beta-adaptin-like protein C n=1 Tax=Artemisia annua TaxID=35608 RepID=A0A2U1LE83_ARTAN|nr:Beta-adaptin-like protein C [Artemisia annua]